MVLSAARSDNPGGSTTQWTQFSPSTAATCSGARPIRRKS